MDISSNTSKPVWEMRRALRLAEKGRGFTLPNPMVGAILIKEGKRIGEGYHSHHGGPHAEVEALNSCKESPEGATLYVTLEPCSHHGKTPPCADAVIAAGIKKVIIASQDPSEKVNGKGIQKLQDAGIEVEVGLLKEEAEELNRDFYTFHQKKRPFITLKAALSLDGKIAASVGEETAITGAQVKKQVHVLRSQHQAILVGAGTVLIDDPHLGVRLIEGRDPLRVILKGKRKLPESAQVFRDQNVLVLDNQKIPALLETLYEKNIISVLVEGGHEIFSSFMKAKIVDELQLFQAPLLLGENAVPFSKEPADFDLKKSRQLGQDLWLTLNLKGAK